MRVLAIAALLMLAAGCASTHAIQPQVAGPRANFAEAQGVDIKLSSFHFTPNVMRLKSGQPIALKLTNAASMEHTFTAPEFFAEAQVAPGDAARVAEGQVKLAPSATVVLHLVPAAGEYQVVCTEFGHALLGMRGKLVVS
jgi:plastocyanin